MAEFSSALKLADLNDFGGQACIKPILIEKQLGKKAKIEVRNDGTYLEIEPDGSERVLESAKISLNDCLACSGCVTSAETVLITAQSTKEFQDNLNKGKTVIVSLSPQSRASLAAHFKLSILQTHKRLITFFKKIGVQYIFDTSFSREFSLMEAAAEFVARYRKQIDKPLPMLASACPGWICYAEKTHGEFILPHISTTKSPQQIMGTIVKNYFASTLNTTPDLVYHVTVMPCYDKKLEASRKDFYNDILQTRDVDCVLATGEILQLISDHNMDFVALEESNIDKLYAIHAVITHLRFTNVTDDEKLFGIQGGSGGYVEYIYRYAAKELFGVTVDKIEYTQSKLKDLQIAKLQVNDQTVLTFATAYGSKNISNIVRSVKGNSKKPTYDFVEVMACDGGCLNGGGQIKDKSKKPRDTLLAVEAAYNEQVQSYPTENTQALELYNSWLHGVFSPDAKTKLHTQYHMVEKLNHPLLLKW